MKRIYARLALAGLTLAALTAACTVEDKGNDSDDDDGSSSSSSGAGGTTSSGPNGSSSTGSGSFECCINEVGYFCPDQAAFDKCLGFDIDGCMAGCAFDDVECMDGCFAAWEMSSPDPSSCTQDANATCSGPGGLCVGDWDGTNCDTDGNCSSLNCFDNKCYGNDAGNPCEDDGDCSSLNCYQNCCYGNDAGDPCEDDGDCSSLNCYQNECQ